jgi:pyrroline-5-carboxylate reductase
VKNFTVAVIGAGNMGRALIGGWLKARLVNASGVRATAVRPETLKLLKKLFKIKPGTDNRAAARGASVVLLGVKPQKMGDVLEGLRGAVTPRQLVISVAAGVRTDRIEKALGGVPVIRVMPNTPSLVGAGALAYAPGRHATAAHERTAKKLLAAVGDTWKVEEDFLDAVTALSGSGPAYVFHLAEAMAAAGVALGLPAALSEALARQTVYGAGLLLKKSLESPATLREKVTSPGGTTAAALGALGEAGFMSIFERALSAACRRSRELSNQ